MPDTTKPDAVINYQSTAPQGRPSNYSAEIANEICRRIALGETLNKICQDPNVPHKGTVLDWMFGYSSESNIKTTFNDQYTRARRAQIDAWVDEGYDKAMSADASHSNLLRVQLDWIKWIASKIIPKVYGDLQQIDVSGGVELSIAPVAKISHKTTGQIEARDAQDER